MGASVHFLADLRSNSSHFGHSLLLHQLLGSDWRCPLAEFFVLHDGYVFHGSRNRSKNCKFVTNFDNFLICFRVEKDKGDEKY